MERIYLDHSATTPIAPEVFEAMTPYLKESFGNASSVHFFGREARKALEQARNNLAEFIGADPQEVIFTSGGTESDNLALRGVAQAREKRGNHIIVSSIEHLAVTSTVRKLGQEGFEITYLPVNSYGRVDPAQVEQAIREDTILISVMMANNEMGTIQPIARIGKIAKEKGVLFHSDAVQALGKIPIDVNELNVDLMSFSAHKIHGPKGVGALYFSKGTPLKPQILGGHHERNRRGGTENVAGIVGFGAAAQLAADELKIGTGNLEAMRDRLQKKILQNVDHVYVTGDPVNKLPNVLHLCFNFIEGEGIVLSLDMKGVAVSSGSACSSGSLEPSHVLSSMGVPVELAQGGIRFSLGRYNTMEQMDRAAEIVGEVIPRLREMSPLWDKFKKQELDMDHYYSMPCYVPQTDPQDK